MLTFAGPSWQADDHSKKPRVLQAVLCAGLYPNVCQVKAPKQQYTEHASGTIAVAPQAHELRFFGKREEGEGRLFVHPSSVNYKAQSLRLMTFGCLRIHDTFTLVATPCAAYAEGSLHCSGLGRMIARDTD